MKILLAEDNAISQDLLRKILVNRGYEVVVAADGRVAWDLLCQGLNPDLCILDIMMPVMSGLELLQKIRRDVRFKDLRTILCSALRDRETIAQGATLGIDFYIIKPFRPDMVLDQVQKSLEAKARDDAQRRLQRPVETNAIDDDFAMLRSINLLSEEIARGIEIAKTALTASALANGSATFYNEDNRRALSPHFAEMRRLLGEMEKQNLEIRRKAPEAPTTALAM